MSLSSKKKHQGKLKEATYFVEGMHCASCELQVEKKLLEVKRIVSAKALVKKGQVIISYKGGRPKVSQLNNDFSQDGYRFFQKKPEKPSSGSFTAIQFILTTSLVLIGFLLLNRSGLATRVVVSSASALPAFFLFGVVAGTSSCAALVGGLVLSMSKQWSEIYKGEMSFPQRLQPHLLFNLGRLVSFAVFGALLGFLGAFLEVSLGGLTGLAMAVSLLMILFALQMLGVKKLQGFQIVVPKVITRYVADETRFKGRYMPFILGALTFFLPCGFTITAQSLALVSGDPFRGGAILLFFALGTLPMLVLIGLSSLGLTAKPHLSARFLKVAGILVLLFGIYNFNSQLNVLGLPSLDDLRLKSRADTQVLGDGFAPIVEGKQLLKMDAFADGYQPDYFKVKAGIPVRWEIKDLGVSGCTNAIVSKGLFLGEIRIDSKRTNVKEFVPREPGRYKFSCWMGMISGTIDVIAADTNQVTGQNNQDSFKPVEETSSESSSCGGGIGCGGSCGGRCGNQGCSYAQ
ncbi:sulfite exporter TauE/SafE family protein [Patescibacteria group bacterium]